MGLMTISVKQQNISGGFNATDVTLPGAITSGNLLVVVAGERSGSTANAMSNSGYTLAADLYQSPGDGTFRKSLAVWYKFAGGSEPTTINVTFTTTGDSFVGAVEFEGNAGELADMATNIASAEFAILGSDSVASSHSTGTTASVTAASMLRVAGCYTKPGSGTENPYSTWSGSLTEFSEFNGGTNAVDFSFAWGTSTTSGTHGETATKDGGTTDAERGAISFILVFPVTITPTDPGYGYLLLPNGVDRLLLPNGVDKLLLSTNEAAPGVSGQASGAFGFTATASGIPRTKGSVTVNYGFTATASAIRRTAGSTSASFGFVAQAIGKPRKLGSVSVNYGFTATASGIASTPPVQGQASASFGFTATANGIARTRGTSVNNFGFTATASGVPRTKGIAFTDFNFVTSANGKARTLGQVSVSFGFVATASGKVKRWGSASGSFGFTAEAQGFPGTPPVTGEASVSFGFVATATGTRRRPGTATVSFGFVATASGQPRTLGSATVSFGFVAVATGIPRTKSEAMGDFGFVAFIVGTRRVKGVAHAAFGFGASASGVVPGVSDVYLASTTFVALITRSAVSGSWQETDQFKAQGGVWV
jgi:hypothetical protein